MCTLGCLKATLALNLTSAIDSAQVDHSPAGQSRAVADDAEIEQRKEDLSDVQVRLPDGVSSTDQIDRCSTEDTVDWNVIEVRWRQETGEQST